MFTKMSAAPNLVSVAPQSLSFHGLTHEMNGDGRSKSRIGINNGMSIIHVANIYRGKSIADRDIINGHIIGNVIIVVMSVDRKSRKPLDN